jgi:hypothetical protein
MTANYRLHRLLLCLQIFAVFLFNSARAQAPVDASSIVGKVVCGYQGWFSCAGDGSPINIWFHWAGTTPPAPGHLSFEVYPDVSLYNSPDLFQTGFADQGDGEPSRLFSSYKQDVIDEHFNLMQTHGIDGVALQRFATELVNNPTFKENRDTIAARVKRSAEKYSRIFYLMYDMSGLTANNFDSMETDWQNNISGTLQITSSPMYARQNGDPVVGIWGFGFTDRAGSASECLAVINWFKDHGCYVVGGVPANWRTCTGDSKPGFENVYKAFNMISPWTVGRYSTISGVNTYKTNYLIPDLAYCNANGMDYKPVVFPGFAWSNWNGGSKNQIPRIRGEFLWQQIYNIQSLDIPSVYMAMFDEYDEGTALLNMADGYNMIPTNQYFLTSSADGTYISPDFYLRLAGKATRVIKGIDEATTYVPIPQSEGPIYFRTSHEATIDPQPTWTSTTELKVNVSAYGSNSGNPACAVVTENPHKGSGALRAQGRDRSATSSYAYFKVYDVNIPVYSNTCLRFWSYPTSALGRYVSVDLIMTDGTSLRDCGALDIYGVSMHPATGRGTVNAWTKTTSIIGTWLNGKTIDRILVAYDHATETGDFRAYFDDISIDTGLTFASWTGASGTGWSDDANWSSGIPSASTMVSIPADAPNMPEIVDTDEICRDMAIKNGATLTISGGYNLAVARNWTNDGTFIPGDGTVTFNGAHAQLIGGSVTTTFNNLTINTASPSVSVTSAYPAVAFTVTDNLAVANGNLILQADDADYNIKNLAVSFIDDEHYGTLTHDVYWGSHAVVITGDLAVDGKWVPAVRSFVKMHAPSGSSTQTLRTGDSFTSSTLSGLILETPGGEAPGGTFELSGTLRVNREAYIMMGATTGSFHLNGFHAVFSGDFLWNQSGSVYIDAGDGGSSPVLDVTDHSAIEGACYISAGTFNNGAPGHSGSLTITGSLTCSDSSVINNAGDLTITGSGSVTCQDSAVINIGGNLSNDGAWESFKMISSP